MMTLTITKTINKNNQIVEIQQSSNNNNNNNNNILVPKIDFNLVLSLPDKFAA